MSASVPAPAPAQVLNSESSDLAALDPTAYTNAATLAAYLRQGDPGMAGAVLHAIGKRDKQLVLEALLNVFNDPAEPRRVQALQLLVDSSGLDQKTVTATLGTALQDPDATISSFAIQALAGRADQQALSLLAGTLKSGDLPTRVLILQSIASNNSALPLIQQALKDPDETVRSTAKAILAL